VNQELLTQPLNRQNLVKLIRKWGDVNTDALLEETCRVFSTPEIEGFIGYKIESSNAVVFGDPICSPSDKPLLAQAFDAECKKKKLNVVYTIVSQDFAKWSSENHSSIAVEFGTKFVFDPHNNPAYNSGSKGVLVRKKVKNALKNGVVVKEYLGDDPSIEKQIEQLANDWVQKRQGPQIYLCQVTLFKDRYGKRWFYATKNGQIVGLLLLNELQAQGGWLLNNVMMINDAPKGLSELLIISTLEILDKEGCRFVLAGPVPSKELGKIIGVGGFRSTLIRMMFKLARRIFQLDGHATFWGKFQPQYESSFLLFPHKNLRFSSIKALMKALNASKG
jgi:lysylphosphatidylglycerol synthetase-like protein (DUF2156 family)